MLQQISYFFVFFSFLALKMLKMKISNRVLDVHHPNAGQNIQHAFRNMLRVNFLALAAFFVKVLARLPERLSAPDPQSKCGNINLKMTLLAWLASPLKSTIWYYITPM